MIDGPLTVSTKQLGSAVMVRAVGEIDIDTAPLLAEALEQGSAAVSATGMVVVDLTGISFCGAAGLSVLVVAQQRCLSLRTPLYVVARHAAVLRPLQVTRLDSVLTVLESPLDAPVSPSRSMPSSPDRPRKPLESRCWRCP